MSALPQLLPRPAAGPNSRPALRLVGPVRHTRLYVAATLTLMALAVFGVVSLNALAAEAAFQARTLDAEVTELSLRYDELTADVAALESPERIRDAAVAKLGMVPAEQPAYLIVQPLTAPRSGSPALASEPAESGPVVGAVADPVKQALTWRP